MPEHGLALQKRRHAEVDTAVNDQVEDGTTDRVATFGNLVAPRPRLQAVEVAAAHLIERADLPVHDVGITLVHLFLDTRRPNESPSQKEGLGPPLESDNCGRRAMKAGRGCISRVGPRTRSR
jgi:hypothetical protein